MELLFDRIHKTASYLAGDREDAVDIAQNACVEVILSAGTYRGEASLAYWADRVTIRTAAKVSAKRARRQRIRAAYYQPPATIRSIDDSVDRSEVRARLAALLRTLKQSEREVMVLRYIHGYTAKEAAEVCGVPLETARGRLKKGRARLKKKVLSDPILREWIQEWARQ